MKRCVPFCQDAPGRSILVGINEGFYEIVQSRLERSRLGIVEGPRCFEVFCIKSPACSTFRARSVSSDRICKWAAQILVPAPKKSSQQTDTLAERTFFCIKYTPWCQRKLQNFLHFNSPLFAVNAKPSPRQRTRGQKVLAVLR